MQIVPLPPTPKFPSEGDREAKARATGPPVFVIAQRRADGTVVLPAAVNVINSLPRGERGTADPRKGHKGPGPPEHTPAPGFYVDEYA